MQKTLFAGLTVLSPDDSLLSDDGAFIGRDRETIDRFLEIGAKTHRHNGLPGLHNPQLELQDVAAVPSGGTIAGDTSFTFGYSLLDAEGGETLLSPTSVVTTPPALEQPLYAPTAQIDYASGALLADTYYYLLTFLDSEGGETPPGAWVSVEREPGFANARVLLSGLSAGVIGGSAQGWRLYRAIGGGTFDYLSSGGVTDTYIDNGTTTPQCDIHPPPDEVNTTNQINQLRVKLPSAGMIDGASTFRLYGTNTGVFLGDVLLGTYPASSAGQTVFFSSFSPDPGAPPDRNHSIGGASKIDPDTDILDWHWKRPVAGSAMLPSGSLGDVRLTTNDGNLWAVLQPSAFGSAGWVHIGSAAGGSGGGGGGGSLDIYSELQFSPPGTILGDVVGPSAIRFYTDGGYPEIIFFPSEPSPGLASVRAQLVPPAKFWASADPGGGEFNGLASGASANGLANIGTSGSDWVFMLSASRKCRVQVYTDEIARDQDAGRAYTTPPPDGHGVLLDEIVSHAGGGLKRIIPTRHLYLLLLDAAPPPDNPTLITSSTGRWMRVTNLDSAGNVVVAFGTLAHPD